MRVALEGSLALEPRLFVERRKELLLRLAEDLAAAAHDGPGGLEHLVEREARRDPAVRTAVNDGTCLGSRMPAGRTLHITPIAVPVLSMLPMPVRVWSPMKQPTLAWPVAIGSPWSGTWTSP